MNFNKFCYKKVLIKLSGEVLQGKKDFGINISTLSRVAEEIKEISKLGIKIGIVVGGGNFFRGKKSKFTRINRITGDYMGILSTIINGLALKDYLTEDFIKVKIMSSITVNNLCELYNLEKAKYFFDKKYIIIFVGGIGNPLFTTDSAACVRAIEMQADVLLKATKVDGVFSNDPFINNNAKFYDKLSYKEIIEKKLKIMDYTALILAKDHNLPIHVFNINKNNLLKRIIMGEKKGTLIN
ncbi:MAG: UMP kinase [Enterobacteriaceae bacterium]